MNSTQATHLREAVLEPGKSGRGSTAATSQVNRGNGEIRGYLPWSQTSPSSVSDVGLKEGSWEMRAVLCRWASGGVSWRLQVPCSIKCCFNVPFPGSPPVHKNMPQVAGALGWARELRARIQEPFGHLRRIPRVCVSAPAKLVS